MTTILWDIGTVTRRCLYYTLRNVDNLMTMLLLPPAMILLFVLVLGGAMNTGGSYVNYAVPGILLLTIGYGAGTTAVSVNVDLQKGIIDRFRTMPIGRSVVLTGHVLASVLKNTVSTLLVLLVAFLIGFRPAAGPAGWLGTAGILLLYTLAMTCLSVLFGLLSKTPDGAGAFSYVFLFLPYVSSAFVPVETMPTALRAFARHQPITPINESVRALLAGGLPEMHGIAAVIWCAAVIGVSGALAVVVYNRKTA